MLVPTASLRMRGIKSFSLDLDRSNLGNARLMGLPDVLGKNKDPTGVLFDWVTSTFFISYVRLRIIVVASHGS